MTSFLIAAACDDDDDGVDDEHNLYVRRSHIVVSDDF